MLLATAVLLLDPALASAQPDAAAAQWQFGGFADIAYLFDPNDPPQQVTRSRGTSFHVNELVINMIGLSASKAAAPASRFGAELAVHAGKDAEVFGFSPTAPAMAASWLRYIGRANVSYLAPIGTGVTIQAGVFASPIGYDSLYAKDNANYTRPWTADFTPYLMLGANASHTFDNHSTVTAYVVNGYWHLANANRVPSVAVQYTVSSSGTTYKQTIVTGPHQSNTALEYWRVLSDTIIERRHGGWIVAINAQVASERVAMMAGRGWWVAAQVPMQWRGAGPWRLSLRPEVAWDSNGRWTAHEQTVRALTATADYRLKVRHVESSLRLEFRADTSTGPQGGFFTTGGRLTPSQRLLIGAVIIAIE